MDILNSWVYEENPLELQFPRSFKEGFVENLINRESHTVNTEIPVEGVKIDYQRNIVYSFSASMTGILIKSGFMPTASALEKLDKQLKSFDYSKGWKLLEPVSSKEEIDYFLSHNCGDNKYHKTSINGKIIVLSGDPATTEKFLNSGLFK